MSNPNKKQLAVFEVGPIVCAISVEDVQEINNHLTITPVYNAQTYIRGISNLRGTIITIVDLRQLLALEAKERDIFTRIIVVQNHEEKIGLLVDKMVDIVYAEPDKMKPTPPNVNGVASSYFSGIYLMEEKLIAILDLDEILDSGVKHGMINDSV